MPGQAQPNFVSALIPFVILMAIFYFVMYLPEKKRKKKYSGMLDALKVNDDIITKGGIIGKIITIKDTYIILETGPSRSRIKLDKNGILAVLNKTEEDAKEETVSSEKKEETEK